MSEPVDYILTPAEKMGRAIKALEAERNSWKMLYESSQDALREVMVEHTEQAARLETAWSERDAAIQRAERAERAMVPLQAQLDRCNGGYDDLLVSYNNRKAERDEIKAQAAHDWTALMRERDEARRLERFARERYKVTGENLCEALEERDAQRERAERAEKERDAAIALGRFAEDAEQQR